MTDTTRNLRKNLNLDALTVAQLVQYSVTLNTKDGARIAVGDASREQLIDAICYHFESKP